MTHRKPIPTSNDEPPRWWYVALVLIVLAALILTPFILTMGDPI